jgi:ABC-type glycerol-3-phosphate transport system substrate-binding protein
MKLMKIRSRLFFTVITLLQVIIVVFVLSSCISPGNSQPVLIPLPPANFQAELTLWYPKISTGPVDERLSMSIRRFNEHYPNITIRTVALESQEYFRRLRSEDMNENSPQVWFTHYGYADILIEKGQVRTVEDLVDLNNSIPTLRSYETPVAVPIQSFNQLMLFYNRGLIEDAPESFADLLEAAADIEDIEHALVFTQEEPFWLIALVTAYGGDFLAADRYTPNLNSEAMIRSLALIRDLRQDPGVLSENPSYAYANRAFIEGRAPFLIDGDWALPDLKAQLGSRLGTARIPIPPGGGIARSYTAPHFLMVNRDISSDDLLAARAFLNFMTSDEEQLTWFYSRGDSNLLPATLSALDIVGELLGGQYEGSLEQVRLGIPMPGHNEMTQVWDAIKPELVNVLRGTKDPQQAAADMQRRAETSMGL